MAFTANDYIVEAAELYGDSDYERVEESDWIRNLNSAIRALILVRPDAGAVTESVQLTAGIKQTLPTDVLRLLDIPSNQGADGSTPGKIITPADRKHIDYANLLWPAATGETYIENFSYDNNVPRIFYVTPPVSSTVDVYVEMSFSQLPTAVTVTGSDPGILDIFFEPVVQFMLFKAFSTDDESVEMQKAMTFYTNFFDLLKIELVNARAAGPEGKE